MNSYECVSELQWVKRETELTKYAKILSNYLHSRDSEEVEDRNKKLL